MTMPPWLDDFLWTYQNLVHALGINGLLALSMYVVLAVGQLSLGQAAFMGLGAYSSALMTLQLHWPFWPGAARLAAWCRWCSRWRSAGRRCGCPGSIWPSPPSASARCCARSTSTSTLLGGALGLSGIPERAETWMIYGLLAPPSPALWLVGRSGIGRAMEAMREDETAAQVMGVNVRRYRMGALVASAALAGIAGALSAHASSFIGPNEYGFEPAVTILSYALLGGIGTPLAPVLGAWILTLLPEVLRGVLGLPAGVQRPDHRASRCCSCRRPVGLADAPPRRMSLLAHHGPDPPLCRAGRGRWRRPRGRGRRHPCRDRPQRRRQDHAVQPDLRPGAAQRRPHRAWTAPMSPPCRQTAAPRWASPAPSRTSASSAP